MPEQDLLRLLDGCSTREHGSQPDEGSCTSYTGMLSNGQSSATPVPTAAPWPLPTAARSSRSSHTDPSPHTLRADSRTPSSVPLTDTGLTNENSNAGIGGEWPAPVCLATAMPLHARALCSGVAAGFECGITGEAHSAVREVVLVESDAQVPMGGVAVGCEERALEAETKTEVEPRSDAEAEEEACALGFNMKGMGEGKPDKLPDFVVTVACSPRCASLDCVSQSGTSLVA
ncbi:hypothetical protein WOLCODRAFT_157951 [Wolfiporia cocos MD-104 SS10]|uniref:Uncharacterized protein n=1 Tax=Wolfiporia cocos (strain MD-104) TaxID=742152 RepID=A0A2H3JHP5_WOLCO|nr:hypothetical protein WOLCODRAFT_157951 [Wolfiporia cocos MD-104 SS10]